MKRNGEEKGSEPNATKFSSARHGIYDSQYDINQSRFATVIILEDDFGVVAWSLVRAGTVEVPQGQIGDIIHLLVKYLTGSNDHGKL